MTGKPTVLFACIHNSGRSVAAQALARHYAGDAVEVRSAGSEPGTGVNPVIAQVLAELRSICLVMARQPQVTVDRQALVGVRRFCWGGVAAGFSTAP